MDTQALRKFQELVSRLLEETRARRVKWEVAGQYEFMLRMGTGSVDVWSVDNDGRRPYRLSIVDRDGKVIDWFQSGTGGDYTDEEESLDEGVAELYDVARRNAHNADAVLDALLTELGTVDEGGF